MNNLIIVDAVIFGGGIAGLWTLHRLRQQGFNAILLESNALGSGQTLKSQGIIHGGTKYALKGILTFAANAIAEMPTIWQHCLQGNGEIDLRNVKTLSPYQYLWSTKNLTSRISQFLASKSLRSRVTFIERQNYPEVFQHENFKGQIYQLQETVLDVHSLIKALTIPYQQYIFKINFPEQTKLIFSNDTLQHIELKTKDNVTFNLQAQRYIFTAGAGNAELLKDVMQAPSMQKRPLHMVLAKFHNAHYSLFAHCTTNSINPRITITSHTSHDNKTVWYLGGQIAEEGLERNSTEQIAHAKMELNTLFPWLDFTKTEWASFFIDRAEAAQPDGQRPNSCAIKIVNNMIIAWPTKLALAPKLSAEIMQALTITPQNKHTLSYLDLAPIAQPIWDQLLP